MSRISIATHCPVCLTRYTDVSEILLIGGRILISDDDRTVSLGVIEGATVREVAQPGGPHTTKKIGAVVYATDPEKGAENVGAVIRILNCIPSKLPYLGLRMFGMRNVTGRPGYLFGRINR